MKIVWLSIACAALAAAPQTLTVMPPLHGEAAAFDPARGRFTVVGGRTPADWLQGTWAWDGTAWRQTHAPDASPTPRGGHALGYDPERRALVLFGGTNGPQRLLCDTWTMQGDVWRRTESSPCITDRVRNASLVHDTKARRMLLVDGPAIAGDEPRPLRIWRRDDDNWTLVDDRGPRRVGFSAAAYDAARGVLVVPVLFGGPDAGTWEWNGTSWTHLTAATPSHRQTYALAYDAVRRRVVLAGGQASTRGPYLDDLWTWDGKTWSPLSIAGDRPPGRGGATLASDGRQRRLILFGGYNDALLGDLWTLGDRGWTKVSGQPSSAAQR